MNYLPFISTICFRGNNIFITNTMANLNEGFEGAFLFLERNSMTQSRNFTIIESYFSKNLARNGAILNFESGLKNFSLYFASNICQENNGFGKKIRFLLILNLYKKDGTAIFIKFYCPECTLTLENNVFSFNWGVNGACIFAEYAAGTLKLIKNIFNENLSSRDDFSMGSSMVLVGSNSSFFESYKDKFIKNSGDLYGDTISGCNSKFNETLIAGSFS